MIVDSFFSHRCPVLRWMFEKAASGLDKILCITQVKQQQQQQQKIS